MKQQPEEQRSDGSALLTPYFRNLLPLILEYTNIIKQDDTLLIKSDTWTSETPKYTGAVIVASNRATFLNNTRQRRAQLLRDHIMHWRYDEIETLVTFDPEVLTIRLPYRMNRWQDQDQAEALSALEYAWLAGDENFIHLFEPLIEENYLNRPDVKDRKEALCKRSLEMRNKLSVALKAYVSGAVIWRGVEPLWESAPHWIFGLALYFWNESMDESKLESSDVYSPDFRRAAGYGHGIFRGDPGCVAVYLSESPTRRTTPARASKLRNPGLIAKYSESNN